MSPLNIFSFNCSFMCSTVVVVVIVIHMNEQSDVYNLHPVTLYFVYICVNCVCGEVKNNKTQDTVIRMRHWVQTLWDRRTESAFLKAPPLNINYHYRQPSCFFKMFYWFCIIATKSQYEKSQNHTFSEIQEYVACSRI